MICDEQRVIKFATIISAISDGSLLPAPGQDDLGRSTRASLISARCLALILEQLCLRENVLSY